MTSKAITQTLPRPWAPLFYWAPSMFLPSESPLAQLALERPSLLLLFSLSQEQALIVNLVYGISDELRNKLRKSVWPGKLALPLLFQKTERHSLDQGCVLGFICADRPTQTPILIHANDDEQQEDGFSSLNKDVIVVYLSFKSTPTWKLLRETNPQASTFRSFVEKRIWEFETASSGD